MSMTDFGVLMAVIGFGSSVLSAWGAPVAQKIDNFSTCLASFKVQESSEESTECDGVTIPVSLIIFILLSGCFYYLQMSVFDYVATEYLDADPIGSPWVYLWSTVLSDLIKGLLLFFMSGGNPLAFVSALFVLIIPLAITLFVFMPTIALSAKIVNFLGKNSFMQGVGIIVGLIGVFISLL